MSTERNNSVRNLLRDNKKLRDALSQERSARMSAEARLFLIQERDIERDEKIILLRKKIDSLNENHSAELGEREGVIEDLNERNLQFDLEIQELEGKLDEAKIVIRKHERIHGAMIAGSVPLSILYLRLSELGGPIGRFFDRRLSKLVNQFLDPRLPQPGKRKRH